MSKWIVERVWNESDYFRQENQTWDQSEMPQSAWCTVRIANRFVLNETARACDTITNCDRNRSKVLAAWATNAVQRDATSQ